MAQEHLDIIKDLKHKVYKPIYFLYGEEPYFIDLISDYIEDNILDEAEKGFNLTITYGRDTEPGQLIETARRFPMMAQYQVVIVKEAQDMRGITELEGYFKNPAESTILVFCYKGKKLDKRTNYAKALKKNAVVFESKVVNERSIPLWIEKQVKARDMQINTKATYMLTEFLGNNLQKITNELGKLELVVGPGRKVTPELIEENIGISKDYNIFELQKALAQKNTGKVFRIGDYYGKNQKNHNIFPTLSFLINFFSDVLVVQLLKTGNVDIIAQRMGKPKFMVQDQATASKNYTMRKTTDIIREIRMTDVKAKGVENVGTTPDQLLKELFYKILN